MKGLKGLCVAVGTLLFATTLATEMPQNTEHPPSREAVFISKDDIHRVVAAPGSAGTTMASLGSVRAGDDRINVDEIKGWTPPPRVP